MTPNTAFTTLSGLRAGLGFRDNRGICPFALTFYGIMPLSRIPREKPASAVTKKLQNMVIVPASPVLLPRCPAWLKGDTWRSKPSKVFDLSPISSGGRAVVQLARPRNGFDAKQCVVLKTFARDQLTANPRLLEKVRSEWDIHSSLDHSNILAMLVGAEDKTHVTFALEHEKMDLYEHLNSSDQDTLSEQAVRAVVFDLLSALVYMHAQGYVHRDVKSENIFLSHNGDWKLGDLGSAVETPAAVEVPEAALPTAKVKTTTPSSTGKGKSTTSAAGKGKTPEEAGPVIHLEGTLAFAAPEYAALWAARTREQLLRATTPKLDVWGVGAVAYDLLMGSPPFGVDNSPEGPTTTQLAAAICRARHATPDSHAELPPLLPGASPREPPLSEGAASFLRAALSPDPARRPTAKQMLEHSWVAA